MAVEASRRMIKLEIDGLEVAVPAGTTVYQAARAAGIDIPIFCYHDRMPPLGACRMCLVRVEKMPKLAASCTLEAADGMVVDTKGAEVVAAQRAVLELLLANHPLDCPICDKGGECPLQDQTFRYGPARSRFVETKRDFAKPIPLGPLLALDRERCIACWRCVRFGEIVAGDDALKGFERGFASEVGTPHAAPVESKFIGNTMAICPVGALTSRSYRFRARPWDNRPIPSTCTYCGGGCATWLDVRGGKIVRARAREAAGINDVWLCDLGFFGHDYVGSEERLRTPLVRRNGDLGEATWDEALGLLSAWLRYATEGGPGRVAFLGGRRLTNEDAFVAARLFGEVVGTPHLDHRVDAPSGSVGLDVRWGLCTTLEELGQADALVLVGCDITEEYPVVWLRIKAALDRGASLLVLHPGRVEVRRHAVSELVVEHGRLGEAVSLMAGAVEAARTPTLPPQHGAAGPGVGGGTWRDGIAGAASLLSSSRRPHFIVGRLALDAPDGRATLEACARLSAACGGVVHVARGRGNDFGAQRFGLLPGDGGLDAGGILRAAAAGEIDLLYVAGCDPATAVSDREAWEAARRGVGLLVVHESFMSATAQAADVVLPTLVLPEKGGTVTNIEGRVLPLQPAVKGPGRARGDAEIFALVASRMGATITYGTSDELLDGMRAAVPELAVGEVLPPPPAPAPIGGGEPPAQEPPAQEQGLVLLRVDRLFAAGSMSGRCRGLAGVAGPPHCVVHPSDAARLGVEDGALVELAAGDALLAVVARVGDATLPGQVLLPRGYDALPVNGLPAGADGWTRVALRPLRPRTAPRAEGSP